MNARHVKISVITLFVFLILNLRTMAANGASPPIEWARSKTDGGTAIRQTIDGAILSQHTHILRMET